MGVLEALFLVQALPPWYTNALKRVTKSPKLHFLDAGLLAALRGITPERLRRDRTPFGAVLETFVLSELLKLAGWADDHYTFSHFRDKERNEVDIVIEDGLGQIVGVEVKASATVSARDFSGLRRLASAAGERFALGLVLYDHDTTVPACHARTAREAADAAADLGFPVRHGPPPIPTSRVCPGLLRIRVRITACSTKKQGLEVGHNL